MSTSLLYHAFGVREVKYLSTEYRCGEIIIRASLNKRLYVCSLCRSTEVVKNGSFVRRFHGLPIGLKSVWIEVELHNLKCNNCKSVRRIKIPFSEGKKSYTLSFERYALELSKRMTISDVANHLNVDWHVIKGIQKKNLEREFSSPSLKDVRIIAIDEINIGKGHKYLTVVLDLKTGAVLFVGKGKGADALEPFWTRVKRSRAKIEAVAVDMSPAYTKAIKDNLKDAKIVYDRFHIIKYYNEKLSDLRRNLYNSLEDGVQREVLKGSRWLLLKNPVNLNEDKNEQTKLDQALKLNEPLAKAYYMREKLNEFWEQEEDINAMARITEWVLDANQSGVPMLEKFSKTLLKHWEGIVAYYDFPISTGPLEATNNKIKTLTKQAYGFRDMDFFRLKIYAMHKMKYKLVG